MIHALFLFLPFSVYFFDIFSRSLPVPLSCTRIVTRSVVRLLSYALTHSVFLFLALFLSLPLFSLLRTHTLEFLLSHTHTPNTPTRTYFAMPMRDCVYVRVLVRVRVRVRVRARASVFSTLSPFLVSLNSSDRLPETRLDPYHSAVPNHINLIHIHIYVCIFTYAYMYINTYTYLYIYIYIGTISFIS